MSVYSFDRFLLRTKLKKLSIESFIGLGGMNSEL